HLEEAYRQLYGENRRLMEYLRELDVPLPQGFSLAAGFLANRAFVRAATALLREGNDGERLGEILAEARKWQLPVETHGVEEMMGGALEERLAPLLADPLSDAVPAALHLLELYDRLGLKPNLWQAQSLFARICHRHLPSLLRQRVSDEALAQQVS